MELREKAIEASHNARRSWLVTHRGRGERILDQAIADAILAIPEIAEALELEAQRQSLNSIRVRPD